MLSDHRDFQLYKRLRHSSEQVLDDVSLYQWEHGWLTYASTEGLQQAPTIRRSLINLFGTIHYYTPVPTSTVQATCHRDSELSRRPLLVNEIM